MLKNLIFTCARGALFTRRFEHYQKDLVLAGLARRLNKLRKPHSFQASSQVTSIAPPCATIVHDGWLLPNSVPETENLTGQSYCMNTKMYRPIQSISLLSSFIIKSKFLQLSYKNYIFLLISSTRTIFSFVISFILFFIYLLNFYFIIIMLIWY